MSKLSCEACGIGKAAPACPKCSSDDSPVELVQDGEKASCRGCGHSQLLPNHCGWQMKIV